MKPTHQPPGCKPCPWCGRTDGLRIEDRVDIADRNRRGMICAHCLLYGPISAAYDDLSAIAAWNKRAIPGGRE